MSFSRVIMVLSLAVLLFILYTTLNEEQKNDEKESFSNYDLQNNDIGNSLSNLNNENLNNAYKPQFTSQELEELKKQREERDKELTSFMPDPSRNRNVVTEEKINDFNYDSTDDGEEQVVEDVPNTDGDEVVDVDIDVDDLIKPSAERFQSINSISSVNRNASNDLRGDIEIKYNDKFTPFNASHIYGEPLHKNRL